jgi:hypothetical protein
MTCASLPEHAAIAAPDAALEPFQGLKLPSTLHVSQGTLYS